MIFAIIRNKYSNFGIKVSIRQTQITIVRSILYSIFEFIKIHFPWTYMCMYVSGLALKPVRRQLNIIFSVYFIFSSYNRKKDVGLG